MQTITKNKTFVHENMSYSGADITAVLTISADEGITGGMCTLGDIQTLSYSLHMERSAVRGLGNINALDYTNGPRTIAGSIVFAVFNKHVIYKIIESTGIDKQHILADELPPFDITVSGANEYGYKSVMRILGVRLVNEGKVLSVNDIYTENTYQYYARDIDYLKSEESSNGSLLEDDGLDLLSENNEDDVRIYEPYQESDIASLVLYSTKNATRFNKGTALIGVINGKLGTNYHIDIQNINSDKAETLSSYDITADVTEFVIYLDCGHYKAALSIPAQNTKLNEIVFSIGYEEGDVPSLISPIITHINTTYVKGFNQDHQATKVFYYETTDDIKEGVINKDNTFTLSDLKPKTEYKIYVANSDSIKSEEVSAFTATDLSYNDYKDFYEFICSNSELFKDRFDYFSLIYDELLKISKADGYKLSIAHYINLLKTSMKTISPQIIDLFVKQANIYEIYTKIGKERYSCHITNFFTNKIYAPGSSKIYLLNQANQSQKDLNKNTEQNTYSFEAQSGFYYIMNVLTTGKIEQLEYYIATDETNIFFGSTFEDSVLLQDEYNAFYHKNYNYTYNKTTEENVKAYFDASIGQTGVSLICTDIDDTRVYFQIYNPTGRISPFYIVFDTTDTIFNKSISKIKYRLEGATDFSINYKTGYINEKESYIVYLQDELGNAISKCVLIQVLNSNIDNLSKELLLEKVASFENNLKFYIEKNCDNEYLNIETIVNATVIDIINEKLNQDTKCAYIQKLLELKKENIYGTRTLPEKYLSLRFTSDNFILTAPYTGYHIIMEFFDTQKLRKTICYDFNQTQHIPIDGTPQYVGIYFEQENFASQVWVIDLQNKIIKGI